MKDSSKTDRRDTADTRTKQSTLTVVQESLVSPEGFDLFEEQPTKVKISEYVPQEIFPKKNPKTYTVKKIADGYRSILKKNVFSHIGSKNKMNASYRSKNERPKLQPVPKKPLVDPTEIIELDDDGDIAIGLGAEGEEVEFDATSRNSLTRAVIDKMASKSKAADEEPRARTDSGNYAVMPVMPTNIGSVQLKATP